MGKLQLLESNKECGHLEAGIMETFKENAEASLDGSEVILETSVSGN